MHPRLHKYVHGVLVLGGMRPYRDMHVSIRARAHDACARPYRGVDGAAHVAPACAEGVNAMQCTRCNHCCTRCMHYLRTCPSRITCVPHYLHAALPARRSSACITCECNGRDVDTAACPSRITCMHYVRAALVRALSAHMPSAHYQHAFPSCIDSAGALPAVLPTLRKRPVHVVHHMPLMYCRYHSASFAVCAELVVRPLRTTVRVFLAGDFILSVQAGPCVHRVHLVHDVTMQRIPMQCSAFVLRLLILLRRNGSAG